MGQEKLEDSQVGEIAPLYKNNGAIDDMLNDPISKITCDPAGLRSATTDGTAASTRTLAGMLALIVGAIVGG